MRNTSQSPTGWNCLSLWGTTVLAQWSGSNFNSEVITSLCKQVGIEWTTTTVYHPQVNGQVERFNHTLESMLSKVISDDQKDWDVHLPKAMFANRTSIHESTDFLSTMDAPPRCLLMSCLEEYHHLWREQKKYLYMLKMLDFYRLK